MLVRCTLVIVLDVEKFEREVPGQELNEQQTKDSCCVQVFSTILPGRQMNESKLFS